MSAMLQEVTVVAPLSPLSAQACINTVQKFGFCIMESPPCSTTTPALAARRSELHTFGEALGVVLKQSPRDEPVEDIKDFSDLDTQKDDRGCVCVCVCIYSRLVFDLVHCLKFLSLAYMTSTSGIEAVARCYLTPTRPRSLFCTAFIQQNAAVKARSSAW